MGGFSRSLRRNWRSVFIGLTILTDILFICLSAAVALAIRSSIPTITPLSFDLFVVLTLTVTGVLILGGLVFGLYRMAYHASLAQQFFLAGRIYLMAVLFMLAFFYILSLDPFPRRFMLIFVFSIPFFFLLGRLLLNRVNLAFQKKGFGVHNVLIAGYENGGMNVFYRFTGLPELGYVVKGMITKDGSENGMRKWKKRKLRQYPISDLQRVVKKERIDGIFIPSPKFVTNGYAELVDVCKRERIKIKVLSPEADRILRIARLYEVAGITIYSPPRTHVETMKKFVKRVFDIVGSLVLIVLFSPIFLLTAAAIYVESGSPIFFRQKRAAIKGGRWFYFYKFRSMIKNADELKESLFELNESDGALFKLRNDPRLTRVGRFIRKYSIDELPQLFNVLKGDMSLVGPRPLPVSDFNKLNEGPEFWEAIKDRARVRPGMTGLWQICGRSTLGFREMILLDLSYVENHSLLFDLEILVGTIPVVIFGRGAY
jgi:exopolysaccharide biosynthesis polyprenyl glycosylphosphotransferase